MGEEHRAVHGHEQELLKLGLLLAVAADDCCAREHRGAHDGGRRQQRLSISRRHEDDGSSSFLRGPIYEPLKGLSKPRSSARPLRMSAALALLAALLAPLRAGANADAIREVGCADLSSQQRRALWWLPVAAAYRNAEFAEAAITLFSPLEGSWHGDGQFRLNYRADHLPAGATVHMELDGMPTPVGAGAALAVADVTVKAAPGVRMVSVIAMIEQDNEEVVAAQVSSTFNTLLLT